MQEKVNTISKIFEIVLDRLATGPRSQGEVAGADTAARTSQIASSSRMHCASFAAASFRSLYRSVR
jgi:hypothetical protein